jgi:hypothetical protein
MRPLPLEPENAQETPLAAALRSLIGRVHNSSIECRKHVVELLVGPSAGRLDAGG